MRYCSRIRLIPLILAAVLCTSGCRSVSEEVPDLPAQSDTISAELVTEESVFSESLSETVGSAEEITETAASESETEITSEKSTETEPEITETEG